MWDHLVHNPLPCCVCQPLPCRKTSPPGCLSLPLLPVWMNVSSLSPWLSNFYTVRFSVSSGCFLFLNCCCCPSFGCARRHSVSTYTAILVLPNKFSISRYSSSSGIPMIQCWHIWRCPRILYYPLLFEFLLFLSVQVKCLFIPYVPNHSFES